MSRKSLACCASAGRAARGVVVVANSSAHAYPVLSGSWSSLPGMERLAFPVSIVEFQHRFAGEQACLGYLAASRWPQRFACPACGGGTAWVLARRHLRECAACGRQTSVTAGTIMDHTLLPLTLWFWAACLVATHTPGISAVQLQRQLGISRYETAWYLLHKLRRAMIAPERGLL